MQNKQYSKLLISLIIITILVTPTSFASAKRSETKPSIKKYKISEDITGLKRKFTWIFPTSMAWIYLNELSTKSMFTVLT